MTFPTYAAGDIAPSAWANLVGDFHDDRLLAGQAWGTLPAGAWTGLLWSAIEDPGGLLQANNIDFLLPAGRLYLIVVSYAADIVSAPDYHLMRCMEGGTIQRLRADNAVSAATAVSTGVLTGLLVGSGALFRVEAFNANGGVQPAPNPSTLTILRVGG